MGDRFPTEELVRRAAGGDRAALGEVLQSYREQLLRMLRLRLDRRLRGRVGASDVFQEAAIEAIERLDEYARDPKVPFRVWLRFIAAQRLAMVHRRHLGVKARDAARDRPLERPGVSSVALADVLSLSQTSPSQAVARKELKEHLKAALDSMDPLDREVLCLRHFEQLSNAEISAELGLSESAASKRYVRAFRRLRGLLGGESAP